MSFKNCAIYDKIVLGKPKTIKDLTFIPILDITFGGYDKFGLFFGGSISPKAFIVLDSIGAISFYNISTDITTSELLDSIPLIADEE
ncbi:MAG TPA: hypothetical protein GX519_06820 [Thermoanaerobacterales bacterium]|nr:hypothetical protein [Thermoanaerobacterales bacterium]